MVFVLFSSNHLFGIYIHYFSIYIHINPHKLLYRQLDDYSSVVAMIAKASNITDPFGNMEGGGGTRKRSGSTRRRSVKDSKAACTCPYCGGRFYTNRLKGPDDQSTGILKHCNQCGYDWETRTANPIKCPKCSSRRWREPASECVCNKCGYRWLTKKIDSLPVRCPNCRTTKWRESKVCRTFISDKFVEIDDDYRAKRIYDDYRSGMGCIELCIREKLPLFLVMDLVREFDGSRKPRLR